MDQGIFVRGIGLCVKDTKVSLLCSTFCLSVPLFFSFSQSDVGPGNGYPVSSAMTNSLIERCQLHQIVRDAYVQCTAAINRALRMALITIQSRSTMLSDRILERRSIFHPSIRLVYD